METVLNLFYFVMYNIFLQEHFDSECEKYSKLVNEKYKLCITCLNVVQYHLQQQDVQISWSHFNEYKLNVNHLPRKLKAVSLIKQARR